MGYEKNIADTTSNKKLERRQWVTPLLLINRIT
jgi:hypothetical protein